ncbi:MAG: CoA-binding protein [Patescibacteria group bacterium]|nr:CoA-binding protein [Patescibacteria group bacterium]
MLNKNLIYAVVGASSNEEKYGYKIFKDLIEKGYRTIPINTHGDYILNQKIYRSLTEVNIKPDVVIFVVKPEITEKVLEEVEKLGIKKVWMQPGSESTRAIKYCEAKNINVTHNACVIIKNKN